VVVTTAAGQRPHEWLHLRAAPAITTIAPNTGARPADRRSRSRDGPAGDDGGDVWRNGRGDQRDADCDAGGGDDPGACSRRGGCGVTARADGDQHGWLHLRGSPRSRRLLQCGTTAGGQTVTITERTSGTTAVTFGGQPGRSAGPDCDAGGGDDPAHAVGAVDVVVTARRDGDQHGWLHLRGSPRSRRLLPIAARRRADKR